MAFEGLSEKLQAFTRKLKGKARITEADLNEMLREVKLALLEADVNFKVVKEFINNIINMFIIFIDIKFCNFINLTMKFFIFRTIICLNMNTQLYITINCI